MPSLRTYAHRKRFGTTTTTTRGGVNTNTNKKKQRKRKNQILYGAFLVVACFVLLPVLYLQHRLVVANKQHSPAIDQDLQNFHRFSTSTILQDKKKQQQRQRQRQQQRSKKKEKILVNNNNHKEVGQQRKSFETASQKHGADDMLPAGNLQQPSRDDSQLLLKSDTAEPLVLTAYLEPPETISASSPFVRNTTATRLQRVEFPRVKRCSTLMQDFPVDDYPTTDPYLPWIHDYFVSILPSVSNDNNNGDNTNNNNNNHERMSVNFVAQNRRRCGDDDALDEFLAKWDAHTSLFQSIPIIVDESSSKANVTYRLGTSREEATHSATRFQCHFHHHNRSTSKDGSLESAITFSEYPFDYEYITWRKTRGSLVDPKGGKGMSNFWLSQLLFSCPIPESFRDLVVKEVAAAATTINDEPAFHLDLIPIRTPTRNKVFLSEQQVGRDLFQSLNLFDAKSAFGTDHYLPNIHDAGRWANLPICLPPIDKSSSLSLSKKSKTTTTTPTHQSSSSSSLTTANKRKPYRLVGCTWTSASYTRRGDAVRINDSARRLEEWIRFHLLVGVEHLYVYDNSNSNNTELLDVTNKFPAEKVTHHRWPCQICNNNRPAHRNPGERSSQYAAEASCRERYGPISEWMTFVDTDEYLIPMKPNEKGEYKWGTVLDEMDAKDISILKFLSSRGKPRIDLMEEMEDQSQCVDPKMSGTKDKTLCMGPKPSETFLKVYNCDYIRPPKPSRFARAMKQIYRTSHVLSHFVHYSTVTADVAISYADFMARRHNNNNNNNGTKQQQFYPMVHSRQWQDQSPELFLDALTQGALIHARSLLPTETLNRDECHLNSKTTCNVGHLCDDTVEFIDAIHKDNKFHNPDGTYCNCWRNPIVDDILVPLLEQQIMMQSQ